MKHRIEKWMTLSCTRDVRVLNLDSRQVDTTDYLYRYKTILSLLLIAI
jgi:hypothetical protein